MKMTYEAFCVAMQTQLATSFQVSEKAVIMLGRGAVGEDRLMRKIIRDTNEQMYNRTDEELLGDYVLIRLKDEKEDHTMMRFSCREMYDAFERGGWDNVRQFLAAVARKTLRDLPDLALYEEIDQYERIRDHLVIRPLSLAKRGETIRKGIYRIVGDFALVLYLEAAATDTDYYSSMVPRQILGAWNMEADEVIDAVLADLAERNPPRMYEDLADIVEQHKEPGFFMHFPYQMESDVSIPVVTTLPHMNGAVAMFYPGVAGRLYELLGENYIIGFTSVHEAILHRVTMFRPEEIRESIVRNNVLFSEEALTDEIYTYDVEQDRIVQLKRDEALTA